jgi:hypothetical protein
MFSTKVSARLPADQKHGYMSYMYGPQMLSDQLYFGADHRIVAHPDLSIEVKSPPAWLLADWLLAQKRGEPLSQVAQYFLSQKTSWNRNVVWLDQYLNT